MWHSAASPETAMVRTVVLFGWPWQGRRRKPIVCPTNRIIPDRGGALHTLSVLTGLIRTSFAGRPCRPRGTCEIFFITRHSAASPETAMVRTFVLVVCQWQGRRRKSIVCPTYRIIPDRGGPLHTLSILTGLIRTSFA